jgi:DNA-binding MarR family transcriptional regulator
MLILYQRAYTSGEQMNSDIYGFAGYQVKRVQQELRMVMDEALKKHGLTTPQYAALSAIEQERAASNAKLAKRCFVTPQTMIRIVGLLHDGGLIEKMDDLDHGRIIQIALTKKGKRVLTKSHEAIRDIEKRMLAGFGRRKLAAFRSHLDQCLKNLMMSRH